MTASLDKYLSNRKDNGREALKKAVKKRGPIRRRRRIINDRPVDFSGKKYFMVVQRTIPRNERIENAASVTGAAGSGGSNHAKPFIECDTCRDNNEYVESLVSRIERIENATNALTAMCTDKRVRTNTTSEEELATTLANKDVENIMLLSEQILSLYEVEKMPRTPSNHIDFSASTATSDLPQVVNYLSMEPGCSDNPFSGTSSLSPAGVSISDYDILVNTAVSSSSSSSLSDSGNSLLVNDTIYIP